MGNSTIIYPYSVSDLRSIGIIQLKNIDDQVYRKIWRSSTLPHDCEEFTIFTTSDRSYQE